MKLKSFPRRSRLALPLMLGLAAGGCAAPDSSEESTDDPQRAEQFLQFFSDMLDDFEGRCLRVLEEGEVEITHSPFQGDFANGMAAHFRHRVGEVVFTCYCGGDYDDPFYRNLFFNNGREGNIRCEANTENTRTGEFLAERTISSGFYPSGGDSTPGRKIHLSAEEKDKEGGARMPRIERRARVSFLDNPDNHVCGLALEEGYSGSYGLEPTSSFEKRTRKEEVYVMCRKVALKVKRIMTGMLDIMKRKIGEQQTWQSFTEADRGDLMSHTDFKKLPLQALQEE